MSSQKKYPAPKLKKTGNWIVSPKAQKILDRIERRKNVPKKQAHR